jgi:carbonic anhydrase
VCQSQIDTLKTALGNTQSGINFNNRVTQPLNHRYVAEMKPGVSPATALNTLPQTTNAKWVYAMKGEFKSNATAQAVTWGGLCASGKEQSPINVVTASVQKSPGKDYTWITTAFDTRATYVKNTGYGFQVFETSPTSHAFANGSVSPESIGGSAKGYSMIGGDKYNFYQVHWHSPSENTVDGKSFPLEAHFVHQLDDTALHGTYHRLAVIALLYELDSNNECNTFLDKFWSSFPVSKGTAAYAGENFDLNKKLTDELAKGYYHWFGSLPTPPCTEGVSWNLLKTQEKVCQRQVDALTVALANTQSGTNFNNRVTMPLNHRVVTEVGPASYASKEEKEMLSAIKVCELQVIYTQRMTQEFLQVAALIHVPENKVLMAQTISTFDSNLNDLIYGNASRSIVVPAFDSLTKELKEMKTMWTTFKALLESNINTVSSSSTTVLTQVHTENMAFKKKAEKVLEKYTAMAKLSSVEEAATLVYAKLQLQYLETIFADVLFLSFNIEKTYYLNALRTAESSLIDVEHSLVYGNAVAGVPDLSQVCILAKMLEAGQVFETFQTHLKTIKDSQAVSGSHLPVVTEVVYSLTKKFEEALELFEHDDGSCDLLSAVSDYGWANLILETNKQRMLSQKVTRHYLKFANGKAMASGDNLAMRQQMDDAKNSLLKCMKGNYRDKIPSPPTQGFSDMLAEVMSAYNVFELEAQNSLDLQDFTPRMITEISTASSEVLEKMRSAADIIVTASLQKKPTLRSNIWEEAEEQATRLQKMANEALLVSFGEKVTENKAAFEATVNAFTASHMALLKGRSSGRVLPRTTDACTLTVMQTVETKFTEIADVLKSLIMMETPTQQEKLAVISSVDYLIPTAYSYIETAIDFYKTGQGTCSSPLSTKVWEISLEEAGNVPFLMEKSLTEYYLLASGHAQTWLARSEAALIAHNGYILEEAQAAILVEATADFKSSWESFRATDEERRLGLQVAYITLNPHPAGSKDALDVAPGTEEYHAVHLKYHPHYRKILYERNYYDIFLLDVTGNLIYSVYKELDYATNFAADGNGIWKDSGLGEAFEAAMAHPDEINVIDWKPYGPSAGAYASFLSTGVRDQNRKVIGVFSTQMPPESQPIKSTELLATAVGNIATFVSGFKFGETSKEFPPPPNQNISNGLFSFGDLWDVAQPTLAQTPTTAGVVTLSGKDSGLMMSSEELLKFYVESAAAGAPALKGAWVTLSSLQRALLQGMCKQAVYLGMTLPDSSSGRRLAAATRATLAADMAKFEANQATLIADNEANLGLIALLESTNAAWGDLKETLKGIADGGSATEGTLLNVVTGTETVVGSAESVYTALATTTRTTTLMTLEILAPMPFTGTWSGGATMKLASLVAEGLINEQQTILPGYNIKSVFFDDKCDGTESSRIVLAEMATKDTYIALGGAGCSKVCEQTAFAASTIRLPFISYECSSASLSDTTTYPELTRFGTVMTKAIVGLSAIANNYSFGEITVIGGDPTKFGPEAEGMRDEFLANGFAAQYIYAFDDNWEQIAQMMKGLKEDSKGKKRSYFMVGTEDYFRKVVCASILAEAEPGITWLSKGSWLDEWWTKSDKLEGAHRKWLNEDSASVALQTALKDFSAGWNLYRETDAGRYKALFPLYATDQKELLDTPAKISDSDKDKSYHAAHIRWHDHYRQTLYDRNYYDIFIFDLAANCIYSVYKESDFATNFATGPWKDSGLGDAFRAAVAAPDNISYIDWKPYGPSAGALAAFMSTGIKDEEGVLQGTYVIQLPPDYVRSIEQLEPQCSLAAITAQMEGAINIVGLGRPRDENMVKPLSCFDGHSPQSFLTLLDKHMSQGYPTGDRASQVPDPYGMMKANAADAICVVAFTVKHLLSEGHPIQDIQKPDEALYAKFLAYMKTEIDFLGASGQVKFDNNDKPNFLVIQQIQDGHNVNVGLIDPSKEEDNLEWTNGGVDGRMWQAELTDPPPADNFPYWVIKVFPPLLICCTPTFSGFLKGWKLGGEALRNA